MEFTSDVSQARFNFYIYAMIIGYIKNILSSLLRPASVVWTAAVAPRGNFTSTAQFNFNHENAPSRDTT
jgi:hypothetical protein